jgi:hypothetical protein
MTTSLELPERPENKLPDLPPDQAEREQRLEETLNANLPPLDPVGDYRQMLDAWAVRHGLTLDRALERLDAHPDPMGKAWADKIRADPASFAAMSTSIEDRLDAAETRDTAD